MFAGVLYNLQHPELFCPASYNEMKKKKFFFHEESRNWI